MTRLDQHQQNPIQPAVTHDELKRQVREEIKHENRRRACLGLILTLVFTLVILLLPVLFLGYMAAKSGFVEVPLLSSWVYKPVQPARTIAPLSLATPETIMNSVIAKTTFDKATGTARITLSEQEVTTLLSSALENANESKSLPIQINSVQVTFGQGKLELYGTTDRQGKEVPILLRATPIMTNGQLTLDSDALNIGSLTIPDSLADMLVSKMADSLFEGLSGGLGEAGKLDGIEIEQGKVTIRLTR